MGADWESDNCWESQEWRLNHLYWIEVKNGPPMRFKMNWAQREFYRNMWYRNNILKARQLGMSTLISLVILDGCLFRSNWHAGINDKTMAAAEEKLVKIKFAYEALRNPPADGIDHVADAGDREKIAAFSREIYTLTKPQDQAITATTGHWATGSTVVIGTALRSMTLQFLHVSELGHVAATAPKKAMEIRNGSLPTVGQGGVIVMESTHEGGKIGLNYEMTRAAMEMVGKKLTPLDFRFFFFSWHGQPDYRVESGETLSLSKELRDYFGELEGRGIVLDEAQKRWYAAQFGIYGYSMRQEFPSTPEEAFETQVEGAIYGLMISSLRAEGRVQQEFTADDDWPLYVSVDIGMSDYSSMWLIQPRGDGMFYVMDCHTVNGKGVEHLVGVIRSWEAIHGQSVRMVFLPHDGARRESDEARYVQKVQRQGLPAMVLKRVRDVWLGIDTTKRVLRKCVFHARCSEPRLVDGISYMAGLNALENYRTAPAGNHGVERPVPLHDNASHASDAFRYFCEAYDAGLVDRNLLQRMVREESGVSVGMARGVPWRR